MRILLTAALLAGAPGPAAADEFADAVAGALAAYRSGDIDGALADLAQAEVLLRDVKARGLAALLPPPPEGWTREAAEDQNVGMGLVGGGFAAAAIYRRGDAAFTLTLIADSPMIAFAAGQLGGMASKADEAMLRIAGRPFAVSDGRILGVADRRVLVAAEGAATEDEMAAVIERLDFDKLAAF